MTSQQSSIDSTRSTFNVERVYLTSHLHDCDYMIRLETKYKLFIRLYKIIFSCFVWHHVRKQTSSCIPHS